MNVKFPERRVTQWRSESSKICIKFYQKLGYTCSETVRMIPKVYGDDSMSDTQIKEKKKERRKDGRVGVATWRSCSPTSSIAKMLSTINPQDRTINKKYYLEVLRRLRDVVQSKQPHLWKSDNWLLHNDNVSAHSAHIVKDYLKKHSILQLLQPEAVTQNPTQQLLAIKEKDFQDCLGKWIDRWKKVIESEGNYFERDIVEITPE